MNSYTRIFIKICSLALWSGVFGFIMIVLSSHDAVAGCYPPAGPTETRSPLALTLHSYALDSMLCIHEFEPRVGTCEHCKSGVWHQCNKYGRWQPHPRGSCSKEEATPYINGYVQYGQPAEDNKSEHQEPEGPRSVNQDDQNDRDDSDQGRKGRSSKDRRDIMNQLAQLHGRTENQMERRLQKDWDRHNQQQSNLGFSQFGQPMLVEPSTPSGTTAGNSGSQCARVAQRIAQELERSSASHSTNRCDGARELLRTMKYAKDNLSKYACYNGEYDQSIAETTNYIRSSCR